MERSYNGSFSREEQFVVSEESDSIEPTEEGEQVNDRDRLISRGRRVLDLCIEENKLLCVQGFVDSQIERGGPYLEVVHQMNAYIAAEMEGSNEKARLQRLQELQAYIEEALIAPTTPEAAELG